MIHLTGEDIYEWITTTSDQEGRFAFSIVPPGSYRLDATKPGFAPVELRDVHILVTETLRLELHFTLKTQVQTAEVVANAGMLQLDTPALGRAATEQTIASLPLVTRNYSQIVGLSPGVAAGVYNAGELGIGAIGSPQVGKSNDGIFAHGSRSYDNNWDLDGISVSDVMGSGATSGGIPIPNPDTLKEFKLQTGLYDASFGRAAGANVSVVTKTGTNDYHGTIFEFLRNNILNANDFFLKKADQHRPDLKQNQFGFTFGGPVEKNKLFFFGSYQGTRQINGLGAGQSRIACSGSLSEPPLTNDRSAAALGRLFGGMRGAQGGVAVQPDGSNINPAALALLNFKLPGGSFLIPTPQTVASSGPIASKGFSVFTEPCSFSENQFLLNADAVKQKNQLAARFFLSDDGQLVTFPGSGLNFVGNVPGFESPGGSGFLVASLADTYAVNDSSLNQARIGFVRTSTTTGAHSPFKWSDVGVSEGAMNEDDELPNLNILGSVSMASAFPRTYTQNGFTGNETLSLFRGPHTLNFGGGVTRMMDNLDFAGFGSFVQFLSWPDFLLGLSAPSNGTNFSNVFASDDVFGLLNRDFRAWEASAFIQDDYAIKHSLTLTLGLRYERIGQFGDQLGRNSSFDFSKADRSPPVGGSLEGYLVASNFAGALPSGVERTNNTFGNYGEGQNTLAPRVGLAWQIPRAPQLALRAAYGIYNSRPPGQVWTESVIAAPFSLTRFSTGLVNSAATFQAPFAQPFPTPASFPLFVPYSATSSLTINALAPNFRPAMVQQFSVNVQAETPKGWLLEVGYVGARGMHLQRFRSLNQALSASPNTPINGVTSNTLANIGLRVPVPGIRPDSLREMESEGSSWYNGLETSLTKRLDHGVELLASYTFSKTLDTDGADINGTSAGNTLTLGDQNSPRQRWGRASFDRTHRFVFSGTWTLPSPSRGPEKEVFGGWDLGAVATVQSGTALTIADTNANNVFGISEDRADLTGNCTKSQMVTGGQMRFKLNSYFNSSCFTTPPVIGADGLGTSFGDSSTGIVNGPGQANLDLAFSKSVQCPWPTSSSEVELRAEFFNAFNHPQFANPDSNFTSPTFGVISSTAVNPRVTQLAVRLSF